MTVKSLARRLELRQVAGGEKNLDATVSGCYAGDLLSWVMANAKAGSAWITVMGVRNSVAVAVLRGVSCILLAEEAPLDRDAKEQADREGLPVFVSARPAAGLAAKTVALLEQEQRRQDEITQKNTEFV